MASPTHPSCRPADRHDETFLSDPDHDPMIPHTLVLKPGLVVHSIYTGYWFWGRLSTDDLWRDLRAVTRSRSARIGT